MSYYGRRDIWQELNKETIDGRCLDGHDYDLGELEGISETTINNSRVLCQLIKLFVDKGILSPKEAVDVLFKYGSIPWKDTDPKI